MSIDAVIDAVKRQPDKTELWLRPRVDDEGRASIAGRRKLFITKNPDYEPQTGDEIWGGAHTVVITKGETNHFFRRMMQLWDGSFETL